VQLLIDIAIPPEQAATLWTVPRVSRFLRQAVRTTGLHAISPMQVLEHDGHIDGHVMIAESHIHVTLYLAAGLGFIDVFSCQDLVNGNLLTALEETLLTPGAIVKVRTLERGDLPPQEGTE
jgi:S-adenosylmethionine/arginine decarboxylase-like enzyme